MDNYFGTGESLPRATALRAGHLNCLYERGTLRYISIGDHELIRMIYAPVRDQNWMTAPYEIADEKIETRQNSFSISYTAKYSLNDLQYEGRFLVEGSEDGSILFYMHGEATSDFKRNRIGICVLHAISTCAGRNCIVTRPDLSEYEAAFPKLIAPFQPFIDIRSMRWTTHEDIAVVLDFDGDIFETEDQRNWTDNSFKTYSTPLTIPFPVQLQKTDKLEQSVLMKASIPAGYKEKFSPRVFKIFEKETLFPKIGYLKSSEFSSLSPHQVQLLRNIPFEHYRVDIHSDQAWQEQLWEAANEAMTLHTKLAVVIYFDENIRLSFLLHELDQYQSIIQSVLVLEKKQKATTLDFWHQVYPPIKKLLPGIPTGAGTDTNFTEWNRYSMSEEQMDFVSYPLNPQAHATDIRSIIENLEGQKYTIESAKHISRNRPVYISPVTFRSRKDPDPSGRKIYDDREGRPWNADKRQNSLFLAAWTAISLRYLVQAAQITLYETVGLKGILMYDRVYPVYLLLQEIKVFEPEVIVDSLSQHPLAVDGLIMRNKAGEHMAILSNFSENEVRTILEIKGRTEFDIGLKSLTNENVLLFLDEPQTFLHLTYTSVQPDLQGGITLPACSLTFMKY